MSFKATERISARVTPETKRKLEKGAARLGVRMSAYLALLIHLSPSVELAIPDIGSDTEKAGDDE